MNLDFFFAFLLAHLQLILLVFERVNLVSLRDHFLPQLLYFELHHVVLDQSLLFALDDALEITPRHLVFKFQLTDYIRKDLLLIFDLLNDLVNVSALIFELFV